MASCSGISNLRLHRPPLLDMEEGNLQEGGEELLQSAQEAVRQADKLCCLLTAAALPNEGPGLRREDSKRRRSAAYPPGLTANCQARAVPSRFPPSTCQLALKRQPDAMRHLAASTTRARRQR